VVTGQKFRLFQVVLHRVMHGKSYCRIFMRQPRHVFQYKINVYGYKTSFTIHDLPKPERPRERLKKLGTEALSAQELLALVIGRGIPQKSVMNIAQELLAKFGNIKAISQATLEELSQIKGIGLAKQLRLKHVLNLERDRN
jgi:ERCC4-type nuclease